MKSPKGCAIVAYLLVTGTVKSREQIADLPWMRRQRRRHLTGYGRC
ncbi:MAG: hypothetical protein M9941_17285 [Anaerolineae bacterium]|nr:hypothetical protein [Anaerolineae bacterium]